MNGKISKKKRNVGIVIVAVFVICFGLLYYFTLMAYYKDLDSRTAIIELPEPENTTGYVANECKVLGVDLIKGEMYVRMTFNPNGNLVDKEGALTTDLVLFVNSATGGENRLYEKGKNMNATDITLDLYGGTVTNYPWDRHYAQLITYLEKPVKDAESEPVPMQTSFIGQVAGVKIRTTLDKQETSFKNGKFVVKMEITRSTIILIVVTFAIVLLWLITLTVIAMLLAVLFGRKVELAMFAFMAGFLFSFVAFRNAMPGAPPIGALSDYVAFFWGYAFISIALIILTVTWLIRDRQKKDKPLDTPPEYPPSASTGHRKHEAGR